MAAPKRKEYRYLTDKVFPSHEETLSVCKDDNSNYQGAHVYYAKNCAGFNNGKTQYTGTEQQIRFVMKEDNGNIVPGLQSEQLAYILLDRTKQLNSRFPSPQNQKMIQGLQMFLDACRERVQDRMNRGVMGDLKK